MASETRPSIRHVLMRLSRRVRSGGGTVDVLEAHNAVIQERGRVALAKYGRRISSARLQLLRNQIADGETVFLILVFRNGKEFEGFAAPIYEIIEDDMGGAQAPAYYDSLYECEATCWFILTDVFKPVSLLGVTMVKDGRSVVDVMRECRTSLMLVEAKDLELGGAA